MISELEYNCIVSSKAISRSFAVGVFSTSWNGSRTQNRILYEEEIVNDSKIGGPRKKDKKPRTKMRRFAIWGSEAAAVIGPIIDVGRGMSVERIEYLIVVNEREAKKTLEVYNKMILRLPASEQRAFRFALSQELYDLAFSHYNHLYDMIHPNKE